jgi:hypothetical protein
LPGPILDKEFLVVGSLNDQVIDDAMRFVDVMKGTIPKPPHGRVIFFPGDVIVSFIEQFHRAVKAAGAVHPYVDWRMIVQILAVVDRSPLNFVDGFIDLVNGVLFFFVHVMGGSQILQMSAGMPQISKRVQICRMASRFVGKANSSAQSNKKHE